MANMQNLDNTEITGWVGWIGFASFMLLFLGFFNILQGVADLARHNVYVHASGYVWVLDYTKWGWIEIIGGVLTISAALSLFKGGLWGRVWTSIIVVLSMLEAVATLPMYPIWSIIILIVDALILYAVMVHGKEVKRLPRA